MKDKKRLKTHKKLAEVFHSLQETEKMKQVGKDLRNQHDLPARLFYVVQRGILYSFWLVTFSRTRENLTSYKIAH